jgi:hypothetical protein
VDAGRKGVDWDEYEPFDPGFTGPLHELSTADARAAFSRLMAAKTNRKEELVQLLARNGLQLDTSKDAIQQANDWFLHEVEPDTRNKDRLRSVWYAVVNDLALYLGDAMIERNPRLSWTLVTSPRRHISFQRHVLTGFDVPAPRYIADIDMLVASYGHRVIGGLAVHSDEFVRLLNAATDRS